MAIVFPESTRLGGSLIGLGIKHKDGSEYRFGYYEADGTTWHSQALRKYANQTLAITHRVRFSTPDTI